jgi:hypothetical protein
LFLEARRKLAFVSAAKNKKTSFAKAPVLSAKESQKGINAVNPLIESSLS